MTDKITIWILGNQLLEDHPAFQTVAQDQLTILMVESRKMLEERPLHPQKRVLIQSAMRHYQQELESRGFAVDYRQEERLSDGVANHIQEHKPDQMLTMAASNFGGRQLQEKLSRQKDFPDLEVLPNTQFLVERYSPYPDRDPDRGPLLEYFYRRMRTHFQILTDEDQQPAGGEWNYDRQNRSKLPEDIPIPEPKVFPPDEITLEILKETPGLNSTDFHLAVTRSQARDALQDFIHHRLVNFGSYQDALTDRSDLVFHSLLSPYLNIGLLDPLEVVRAVEAAWQQEMVPLNSAEGFIRQVLGWREYIYWQYWQKMPHLLSSNHWGANRSLPGFFWTGDTDLNCLGYALKKVLRTGYNHHIERLMLISNFCTLAAVQPQEVLDWFLASYLDAYPWVMVPNVIGMGLNADGGGVGTKPYISSANYINKMGVFCGDCKYKSDQRTGADACPFNYLYWNFILNHQDELRKNPRMALSVSNLRHLDDQERQAVREQSETYLRETGASQPTLSPEEQS